MNLEETKAHAKDVKVIRQTVLDDLTKSLPERKVIAENLLRKGEKRLMDDLSGIDG